MNMTRCPASSAQMLRRAQGLGGRGECCGRNCLQVATLCCTYSSSVSGGVGAQDWPLGDGRASRDVAADVARCPRMRSLQLARTGLLPPGAARLGAALQRITMLQELDLSGNALGPAGARMSVGRRMLCSLRQVSRQSLCTGVVQTTPRLFRMDMQ